jgi:hypothetical protein
MERFAYVGLALAASVTSAICEPPTSCPTRTRLPRAGWLRSLAVFTWTIYSGSCRTCSPDAAVQTRNLGVSTICVSRVLARSCRSTTASFAVLKILRGADWATHAFRFQVMHHHATAILSIVSAYFPQRLFLLKRTSAGTFLCLFIAPQARTEQDFLWLTILSTAKAAPFSKQWRGYVL